MRTIAARVLGVGSLACVLACTSPSGAVIVSGGQPMPPPPGGWVGWWAGSSAVCVGQYWIMTAKHVGGGPGWLFLHRGVSYFAVQLVPHPTVDVMLVRLDRPLPGWHRLGAGAAYGDPVILGGHGLTTNGALPGDAGWNWSGEQVETWGANTVSGTGNLTAVTFDRPTAASAVPYEATFAVHDSGAGLFTVASDDALVLAGIAVSVSGWGDSRWGNSGYCVNADLFRNWAAPYITPLTPISSGVLAPRSLLSIPGLPDAVGGTVVLAALATLRRRRGKSGQWAVGNGQ